MFRRLYWIAEQVNDDGTSKFTGVYTSIQDLVNRGMRWSDGNSHRLRLTLVQPDIFDTRLGQWTSPGYGDLVDDIHAYVESDEYSEEEVALLLQSLHSFTG